MLRHPLLTLRVTSFPCQPSFFLVKFASIVLSLTVELFDFRAGIRQPFHGTRISSSAATNGTSFKF